MGRQAECDRRSDSVLTLEKQKTHLKFIIILFQQNLYHPLYIFVVVLHRLFNE